MIAIVPINSSGTSSGASSSAAFSVLPVAAMGKQAAQQGLSGFASILAAAQSQSSQSSRENDAAENGLPEYGLPENGLPENGSQEAGSLGNSAVKTGLPQPDPIETFLSKATAPYGSMGTAATISTVANAQSVLTNSQFTNSAPANSAPANSTSANSVPKKAANVNMPTPMPVVSAAVATVPHASQLPLAVVPASPQQPESNQDENMAFDASQRVVSTGAVPQESQVSTAPAFSVQSSGSAADSVSAAAVGSETSAGAVPSAVASYTTPNHIVANGPATGYLAEQAASVQQPAAGFGAVIAELQARTSAQAATPSSTPGNGAAIPIAPATPNVSNRMPNQDPIQNISGPVSSPSGPATENSAVLIASDSAALLPSVVHFSGVADSDGGISSSAANQKAAGPPSFASGYLGVDRFTFSSALTISSAATTSTPTATAAESTTPALPDRGAITVTEMRIPFSNAEAAPSATPELSAQGGVSEEPAVSAQDADESTTSAGADSGKDAASILSMLAGAAAPASMAPSVSVAAAKSSIQVPGQLATAVAPAAAHAASGSSPVPVASAATAGPLRLQSAPASVSGPQTSAASGTQTPFSVFFSDAAATDSAAAVLPKMILPASFSGIASHLVPASASSNSGATAQTSAFHTGAKQNAAPQIASAPAKESASDSGNSPAPQPTHTSSDPSANPDTGAAEPAAAQTPAAPVSAQMSLPGGGQTASAPNATPQLPTQPNSPASSAPALAVPSASVPSAIAASAAAASAPQVLGAVQAAQLLNRAGQSEMRIGLNTTAFGSVEVRTTVRTSDVGLVIGSEKGDLHTLLANELPAVANTLQQQNLRLNSVNFTQGFAFSNNPSGGGNPQQQRTFSPTPMPADSNSAEGPSEDYSDTSQSAAWSGGSNFSILA